jgi:hypothetical protein
VAVESYRSLVSFEVGGRNNPMYASLAEIIIENERSDYRFESFTREICEKHEGIDFVATSQSWDRGRDARSTAPGRGSHRNLICATLNKDINAKAEADLLRVTATSSPDRLICCSSQRLSEEKIDEITKLIRRHVPAGSVLVLGGIQLGTLAEKYADVFEKYYAAEVQTIRSTILATPARDATTTRGLRLALIAFGSDEAVALRQEILRNSVLEFFGDEKRHTIRQITEEFSKDLGLPRALRPDLVSRVVAAKEKNGTIRREGDAWVITEFGREQLKSMPVQAAANLLEGRQLVRERLESLTGKATSEVEYQQLWSGLMDFLGGLFYANGLSVIRAVEQFLAGTRDTSTEEPNLRSLLIEGINRTVSVLSTPELRETVALGILDMLTERAGPAFDWFTKVAERFVILCSLGLEVTSGDEIRKVVRSHEIILDSDIILSYLCEGEVDHRRSKDLLSWWLQLGGRLLVSPVVLEEVAYHAWIAERDFQETEYLLGKLQTYELRRYIKSAFVRTYHLLEKNPKRWPMYIGQFRGNSNGDYSKIFSILRQRLKVETLPESYDEQLRKKITDYLMVSARDVHKEAEQLEDVSYKVNRDGRLMASIATARSAQEKMGSGGPIVLLSSSYQLRRAENYFRQQFGDARVLLSIGALSYLLATVPDAGLGADSLRRALFEFGGSAHLKDPERRALRIIRATEEFDIPWAQRKLLEANLTASIRSEAEKRGVPEEKLRAKLASGGEAKTGAQLIAQSLRDMAVMDKTSGELAEAQRKIDRLQGQILELEENLKAARRSELKS